MSWAWIRRCVIWSETWRSRQRQTEWAIETSGLMDQLEDTLRVTIYRIVQECLTNVARHAGARRTSVRVAVVPAHGRTGKSATAGQVVDIWVEDDGKGMRPETPFGLGLMGIEERVQALGGAMALSRNGPSGVSPCVSAYRSTPTTAIWQRMLPASRCLPDLHPPEPGRRRVGGANVLSPRVASD